MSKILSVNLFVLQNLRDLGLIDQSTFNQAGTAATAIDQAWASAHSSDFEELFDPEPLDTVVKLHDKIRQLQQQALHMDADESHGTVVAKLNRRFPTAHALQEVATFCRNRNEPRSESDLVILHTTESRLTSKLADELNRPAFVDSDAELCITDCEHVQGLDEITGWFQTCNTMNRVFTCPVCRRTIDPPVVFSNSSSSMHSMHNRFAHVFDVMWLRAYVLVFQELLSAAAAASVPAAELSPRSLRAARLASGQYRNQGNKGGSRKTIRRNKKNKHKARKSRRHRKSSRKH